MDRLALTTKAPYRQRGDVRTCERPPAGFEVIYVDVICRHGSRTMARPRLAEGFARLLDRAADVGRLTPRGQELRAVLRELLEVTAALGAGMLTGSGRREARDIGVRLARRVPALWRPDGVDVVSAGKARTTDSAATFVDGLRSAAPGLGTQRPSLRVDDALLYFHKSDARYREYVDNDPRPRAAIAVAWRDPNTRRAVHSVLCGAMTPTFVATVDAGDHRDLFADGRAAASALYTTWAAAAGLGDEGNWRFHRFVPPAAAAWFGYLDDLETFFLKGPAFADEDVTYAMARPLLDDVFARFGNVRGHPAGPVATLRFTHAEEILPLATLLRLPGSTDPEPPGRRFTYADNPFRGAEVAPMGANIQWELYGDGSRYLVRMLRDEQPVAFPPNCAPIAAGSCFYDLDVLQRAWASGARP